MKSWIIVLLLAAGCAVKQPQESISGNSTSYKQACQRASSDPLYFQQFRSHAEYSRIVEIGGGEPFIEYLRQHASRAVLDKVKEFERLDQIGSPRANIALGSGQFSATTLRYIAIAVHIKQLFSLPDRAKIAEIGAGFGGQCFVLSQLFSFADYAIFDLPEAKMLIEKVLATLNVKHVTCKTRMKVGALDLVISNYAFSECERKTQLEYFNKVIKKAKRGYITYNQIGQHFGIDYLSPQEFIELLKQNGKHPRILKEPVQTHPDNLLIIWDESEI